MLHVQPSKHGRPGDLVVATPHAPLVASALIRPTKNFMGQPVFDLGLGLEQADLVALRAAMFESFRVAYPDVRDAPRLPIRAAQGRDLLWVETLKPPVCLDADDQPIDPPEPGALVKILFRACPWHRAERGQGVNAFLQKLKLAPMTSHAQIEAA